MKGDRSWIPGEVDLEYIEATARPIHPVLRAIEEAAEPEGVPILDRASGRVLAALAAGRRRVCEVGTAFGYSTLWIALGQPADGTIVTIDPDRSRTDRARRWWREAGIADERITVVTDRALDAFAAGLPELAGPFDLGFIDALKEEYLGYFEMLVPRLVPGALVVADNVLWSGRVSGARPDGDDRATAALRSFNATVLADPRFEATILPVGDGLLVAGYRGRSAVAGPGGATDSGPGGATDAGPGARSEGGARAGSEG
ncbi:MAG TPA: O-methyltransferase, partial [Candidatus Limnocylindrales bacterium]|nr:O-methyltransferase [Candidatus Limnocylindrales bacterium]